MAINSNDAIDIVLQHEGGYNDIKEDRGGATNFGISLAFYKKNINEDATNDTIKNLTKSEAEAIYKKFFWDCNNFDKLESQKIANKLFNVCVNLGNSQAIKLAQRVCNIKDDGICGEDTINKINSLNEAFFINVYIGLQKDFYIKLVENNPELNKFLNGWLKRAEFKGE